MKLFVQTTIVFFGTLLAAALVAFGEPGNAEVQMSMVSQPAASVTVAGLFGLEGQ